VHELGDALRHFVDKDRGRAATSCIAETFDKLLTKTQETVMVDLTAQLEAEDDQMQQEKIEAERECSAEAVAMQVVDSVIAAGKKIQAEAKAQAAAMASQTAAQRILLDAEQNDTAEAGIFIERLVMVSCIPGCTHRLIYRH
jgi:hypothetical protein